ncbi:hypothetical protein Droror1_Dr00026526, partial [Drosera rotundifolia]
MKSVQVISLALALCGFCSYVYHHYLDDAKDKKTKVEVEADDGVPLAVEGFHGNQTSVGVCSALCMFWFLRICGLYVPAEDDESCCFCWFHYIINQSPELFP